MSRNILRVPTWRDEPVRRQAAPTVARRLVVLCDVADDDVAVLRRHLPGVSIARVESRGDGPAAVYEHAATRLLGELQRLLDQPAAGPCHVQVVCREGTPYGYAGLVGMLRTAAQEDPAVHGQLIEFTHRPSGGELAEALQAEAGQRQEHLRYIDGRRQVRHWDAAPQTAVAPVWKADGVYLVSGGAGGVGRLLAADIARHAPEARIVLCGRSVATEPVPRSSEYRRVDVTDPAAVAELVDDIVRTHGRLDGIVHAAGLVSDDYVIRKSHQDAQRVLAPKVAGLVNLDEATRDLPLDFLAAFSSGAGTLGNAGQADYAAANGFLDAYQVYRDARTAAGERRGRSVSIGWPLWRDGGMGVPTEDLPGLTARFGRPLATDTALRALHGALALGTPHLLVMDGESDVDEDRTQTAELRAQVLPRLKELVAETVRLDAARLDAAAPLDGFGIDSLAVTRLNRRFAQWFGALPKTLLYQYPTLNELAGHLAEQHPDGCHRWLGGSPAVTGAPARPAAQPTTRPRPVGADEPIAVIGLSGRYPDAPTVAAFWDNLRAGRESVREIPAERWPLDGFYEPDAQRAVQQGASYNKWGAFLADFARFDAAFFGIAPRDAADMDPQERLFIEVAWAVLEDAGYTRQRLAEQHRSRVGVFAGITKTGFDRHRPQATGGVPPAPRTSFGSLANRVSYLLDLHGPSMPIDTMCSASLTAIHEACEHLRHGACELAIAGGVNLYLHPSTYVELCRSRMLATDGHCRSFGAGGDGFAPGEGVGAVLLKPLSKAEADGDPIHAVILGSAVNHGGRTNGYTVPNPRAQAALIREALDRAGVSAADIGYVEAHGTGTRLGDPVEVDGLTQAFAPDAVRAGSCALGSAKSNIGHLEAAAGIAGLTKAVLQLQHGEFAPTLHADRPNPDIDFAATPFALQTSAAPWPRPQDGGPRMAGISSFGAGGANAHVIVAEYQGTRTPPAAPHRPELLPLSARTPEDLYARAEQLAAWLRTGAQVDLPAVAATLQTGREEMDERLCFVASTPAEWLEQLHRFLAAPEGEGPWCRRRVRATRETLAALADKEELRELVALWTARSEWGELAAFWAKGMPVDWTRLHTGAGTPERVHLPSYPFAGRRFWFGPVAPAESERAAPRTTAADGRGVERVLLDALGEALQMPVAEIERRRPFADYGLDSILGVNLVHTLNAALDTALETTDLFDHGTVERLHAFITSAYGDTLRTAEPRTPAAAPADDAVAVVGMAARYADAEDPRALWDHLMAGDDLVEPVTRWALGPDVTCRSGSFVRGIDQFDPVFFAISGVEATYMDPQQRIFLEQCWNALEDAGYTGERLRNRNCGVYAGCYAGDYHDRLDAEPPAQALWGTMGSVVASRIAYHLDLKGPALTTDTSCSSSLVSLHLACRDLREGAADMAIAGGVFIQATPRLYESASRAGMLSATGRCHSFDARADGFVPGEGAGAVVLKRLADAQRDGDHIYGVIRGSGINQDGTTNGITAPSAASQEQLLRAVHAESGIRPGGIQLVEAHGTGTQLGDPIEFRALTRAFDGAPVGGAVLGSIKTNLGHTQFAAGIAGVIKVLLALEHRQIPPSLHFAEANRAVALDGSPFTVATTPQPWTTPTQGPRRAAVSSFGASGTNAHVVLEEYQARPAAEPGGEHAFLLSARTPAALRAVVERLLAHLDREPGLPAGAVAYSLAAGRSHFAHRLAVVAADLPTLAVRLSAWLSGTAGDTVAQGETAADPRPVQRARHLAPTALAEVYVRGEADRFAESFAPASRCQVPLPTYPFERQRYWIDTPAPNTGPDRDAYRLRLGGEEFFLADHHVGGRAVLPGVLTLEFARRAATGNSFSPVGLRDIVWPAPFPVGETGAELRVDIDGDTFRVLRDGSAVHAQGSVGRPGPPAPARLEELRARCVRRTLSRQQCRDALDGVGIRHGDRLRAIDTLAVGDGEAVARLVLPGDARDGEFVLHPAMLDSAVQAVVALHGDATGTLAEHGGPPALPFALDAVDIFAPTTERMWAHLRHSEGYGPSAEREVSKVDIDLYDDDGRLSVSLRGYASRRMAATAAEAPRAALLAPVWDALPAASAPRLPAAQARVVLLGGSAEEQAELRRHYPDATVLDAIDDEPVDQLAARLPADAEHLFWLAPARAPGDPTAAPARGTFAVFRLVKALLAGGADARELGLTAVTRQARLLPGDTGVEPAHAGVHGLLGTLAKEYPHWCVRVTDVEADAPVPWTALLALPADPGGEVLAHRHGEWYRQRLLEVPEPGTAAVLREPGGVIVAIGGAGGIGVVWTEHMMRRHGAQVVWIGRRPLDADIAARQDALSAYGPKPDYVQADATDRDALRRACDEIVRRHGPVRGILHTAIVLGDQSLARMDEDRFRATYAAKADVSVNLADAFAGQPLDFVAFFSSMQAFFKAPGQANYAAGCTFADAFAEQLATRLDCPVKVMNWGYWAGVGIVTADGYRQRMARLGLGSIEPDEGMAAFDALLAGPYQQLALLKATNSQSIDGIYGDDAITHLPATTPSLITALREERPDRRAEIDRLRRKAGGHAGAMQDALARMTWALLRSMGLFRDGRAATAAEWRAVAGVEDRYERWMAHTLTVLADAGYLRRTAEDRYAALDTGAGSLDDAWAQWDRARSRWLADEAKRPQAILVDTTLRSMRDILTGRRPATDVMFPNASLELVEGVYKNNPVADYFNEVLADTLVGYLERRLADDPSAQLRILEIGAGTGGTSDVVFRRLRPWAAHIEKYSYTDISKAFLLHARREYAGIAPYLDTQLFNAEKPLADQPVACGEYDVVIATNVLHATRNIRNTLRNAKAAARSNGLLLLNELSDNILFSHLTFGLLDGWWLYDDPALRIAGSPGLAPHSWRRVLGEVGFRAAFVAAEGADDLGQQVIAAESDGAVRQPRPGGESAFRGVLPQARPRTATPQQPALPQRPAPVVTGGDHDARLLDLARDYFRGLVADILRLPVADIRADVPFDRYGIDSILVVQLTDAVRKVLDHVGSTLFFEVRTIDGLVRHFNRTQPGALSALVGLTAEEPVPADARETVTTPAPVVADSVAATQPAQPAQTAQPAQPAQPAQAAQVACAEQQMAVAIVGMAGRYPGARDLDAFWDNLLAGRDSITEIPAERWDHSRYYDERRGVAGKTYSKWGGFLDGIDEFDPLFFGISPKAASTMDPQERLFLQCAHATLEDAGYTRDALRAAARARVAQDAGDVGVFVGAMYSEYQLYGAEYSVRGEPIVVPGSLASIANRVSYFLDASGPSVAVDTMCASALSAIHLACTAIQRGECGAAVAGGVNLSVHPSKYLMIGEGQFASSDGRCRSFGEGGDGYVPGEGVGAVLLRPLADAVADGDRILGVIRGSALNHGGHTHGFTVPNPLAQAAVIRSAWRQSDVDPRDIGYIEAHGTGTSLGDPIEIAGLNAAFAEFTDARNFCAIGSAKSNIGHLESAAGIAGLTKLLLQLRHSTLVPSLHAERTNPNIDFTDSAFVLQREAAPWPTVGDRPRLGGISSFGAGGSNAHLLVEEYIAPAAAPHRGDPVVVVLSAFDEERLRESAGRLRDALRAGEWSSADLGDIAYTLQVGREAMAARFAAVVSGLPALVDALDACARGGRLPEGAYLNPGGGRNGAVGDFSADADFQETVARWARRGKLARLADAWTSGLTVDWKHLHAEGPKPRKVGLPGYPFARERYWYTDGLPPLPQLPLVPEALASAPAEPHLSEEARPQTMTAVPTAHAQPADSHELPAGDLTLCPVWEPVRLLRGRPYPSGAARVLAVGLEPDHFAALRACCPQAVALDTVASSVDEVRDELAAVGAFDHVIMQFPTGAALGPEQQISAQRAAIRRMFRILKALPALGLDEQRLGVTLLTRNAFDPGGCETADPAQASLHGLIGGLAKEQPQWRIRAVDLADGEPFVAEEVFALPADRRAHPLARRGGQWLRRQLLPVDATEPSAEPVLRRNGVYVLIGGAGDLGVLLSEYLVRQHDAHVVWVGRRAEDEAIRAKAAQVAAGGRTPVYLSADASDPAALTRMRDEVIRRYGRIDGVVHLAMVFSHTPLARMSERELEATLSAKVDPCVHFADVFAAQGLDFVLLVSSLVSFIRNPNQAHYSAACAFEDARAGELRRALDCPVKVVNWGYWGNVPDELLRQVTDMGLAPIDPATAMGALERLLGGPLDHIGFMRLGRPLPVEGVLTGQTLAVYPHAAAADAAAAPVAVPTGLAEYQAGPVPGEIDALLRRYLAAQLRRAGLDQPRHGLADWKARSGIDARFDGWLSATLRTLAEHGLIDAQGRWSSQSPIGQDTEACRAEWARDTVRWTEANADLRAPLKLLDQTLPALADILRGRVPATDVLFPQGSFSLVEGVYRNNRVAGYFNAVLAEHVAAFLRARHDAEPSARLRVLEIGAGTGGTTGPVLDRLARAGLDVAEYCYTDLSQAFLQHAQDTFGPRCAYLTQRIFDVARPPHAQGLDTGAFDVVIAANVLHATDSIRPALRHAKALLRGNGLLALNEISGFYLVNHLTFGLLDGWWLYDDGELRVPGSPALPPQAWRRVLEQEGFTGIAHPADGALPLGQQVVLARSDGLARSPRALPGAPAVGDPPVRTSASPAPALNGTVADVVLAELAEALRMPAERIDPDRAFADYGLDSIVGARFVQRLNEELQLDLLTTVIFDHRSAGQLAAHISASHQPKLPAPEVPPTPAPAAPAVTAPAPAAAGTPHRPQEREPIAIVGISGRFAKSDDVEALWQHLAAGSDLVGPIDRWDLSGYSQDELSCRAGSFIDGIDRFDARFFNLTGLEATYTDPQQRLFLEQAWTALEDAGYAGASLDGRHCGVYVGCTGGDYPRWFDDAPPAQAAWGNAPSVVPARIAYHLNLQGPAIAVDTACSSSLVAVHLACQGLWSGETELAIAGGVSVQTTPDTYLAASRGGMLSPTGRCHTFDAAADGFVPGEGVGVVVLRRLSDALADGDHIHAVVRGSAINQDGATNGITAPSALSQERLIRRVHAEFGIDPAEIGMVEAHGTGTPLGDPIECQALANAFGAADTRGYCALGSIKTNLGHTTSAAGVAGLLKIVLAMRHGQIPPSLHHHETNPAIRLADSPFHVNTALRPWQPNSRGRRVAALSAFGFSGTNGHLVVEDFPPPARRQPTEGPHLFVLSAPQPAALRQRVEGLLSHLRRTPDAVLGDVSYTLAVGRDHFTHRAAFVARNRDTLVRRLEAWLADGRGGTGDQDGGPALECARAQYLDGAPVDFAPLFCGLDVRRTPLPTYPFQRKSYWAPTAGPDRHQRGEEAAAGLAAAPPVTAEPAPAPRTSAMDASTLRFLVCERLLAELSRVLMMEPDEIDPQASFSDFGVDSVLNLKLVGAVNSTLGIDLSSTALFEHSSLDRLTDHVVARYGARLQASGALGGPGGETDQAPAQADQAPAAEPGEAAEAAPDVPVGTAPAAPAGGSADDGIAVVGIAARFAQSPDAETLWAHLAAGDDLVGEVTRWDMARELGAGAPRQYGSFVDDIERFDAWFFRMSGKEATYTDPQQRIFLEECWHALEDAGYAGERLDGRGCGVYVGGSPSDYQQLIGDDAPPQTLWGNISSVIASRISYFLDLQGPALSVDTACSSSLVAIHQACQDLRQHNTSMALAGGVFIQSTPIFYRSAVRANMLSARGRCHTFDARADGFVPGEGAGVVVLKRLADALRDGDQVYGVIRGSGMNQDGTTNGLTAPSAGSQERLLRAVHDRAGVDPAGIQLIEAHGTGTPLGDPIEFAALRAAFGEVPEGRCALGSVKTNLGHTQFAAGVAGVIKVLLALEHEQLPPSLHFSQSNPAITLEGSPFYVNTELRPWPAPASGPRRAGVSSFGAAGTNAHALIEQAPAPDGVPHGSRPSWLVVLSAQDDTTRRAQAERLLDHALAHEDLDLGNVAYTLATGRRHCGHRWSCAVSDREQLIAVLRTWLRDGRAEGVFTGETQDGHRRQDPSVRTRVDRLMSERDRHDSLVELAQLFAGGTELAFAPLFEDGGFRIVSLPPYPFGGERYWAGSRTPGVPATSPLEGRRRHDGAGSSCFAVELTGNEFFLDHHRVRNVPVLPGVAYLEMAYAAARAEGVAPTGIRLRNVVWLRPARITEPTSVEIALRSREDGEFTYEVTTAADGAQPVAHGQGRIARCDAPAPARLDIAGLRARCDLRTLDHDACYRLFERMGIGYGPALRGVRQLSVGAGLAVARLSLPRPAQDGASWTLHPSMLDAALQATVGLSLTEGAGTVAAALPFVLEELQLLAPSPASGWAVVRPAADDRGGAVRRIDIELCDDDGEVCVRLLGFSTRVLPADGDPSVQESASPEGPSLTLMRAGWRPAEPTRETRRLVRHEVLLGGLGEIDPAAVQAGLGVPCAALPHEDDLVLRYTRHAETVLERLRQAVPAAREGQVLLQVVVPANGEDRLLTGLGGLLRTARMEHPKLVTQLIETETPVGTAALCERLRGDAASLDDVAVRYAGGRRQVPQWTAVEGAPPVQPWKPGGVYLVTGGAGGLGALFARQIARQAPGAALVLCGRSPEGPAQRELRCELDDLGVRAAYRVLDVSRRDAVAECVHAIVAEHGRLDGVLHMAGVVRDGFLAKKSAEELREVLAAKAAGFVYLDEATADLDLDCFIGFSSLSAFGNQGQADYAAANAFIDAYALLRHERVSRGERRGRTLVVGWPLWADGGMKVDAATERRLRESVGMVPMRARQGVEALARAYGSGAPHVLAIYGERARIDATLLAVPEAAGAEPLTAPGRATSKAAVLRRLTTHASIVLGVQADDIDGAVELGEYGFDPVSLTEFTRRLNAEFGLSLAPKLFLEHLTLGEVVDYLLDNHPDRLGTDTPSSVPTRAAEPVEVADRDAQRGALLKKLVARVSVLLDVPAERVSATAEMTRYGFDSLSFIGFANELNAEYGLSLAPTLFFESPTLGEVADHLLDNHADRVTAAPAKPAEPPATEPAAQRPAVAWTSAPGDEPIAVIGISGRFPMADDLDEFWDNLREGRDCTQEVPADRWDWRAHFGDPVKEPNTSNVTKGGFINGVGDFDPLFFDISPKEAELMDPQQRLLMLYVWKALEDAGYSAGAVAGTNTALIVGTTSTGYSTLVTRYSPVIEGYDITGAAPSMGPNRMSYFLDLHGPSEPVDTACSSALIAVHRAIQAIREGQSDIAIAGGVNTMVSVDGHISISKAGMLSPEGRCKTFSDRADGYARGEGVGMLVLKRLSAAERDGDHIYGLIRATAENHGGRGSSLTAPNPKAQASLLREAYRKAGIDPRTVGYIEAHGTGTRLGDPVEINGLKAAFRELYEEHGATVEEVHCAVGSVKTNIGHLELAAGVAGVIKVLLQMRHRTLVKSLHCETVNPYIDLAGSPFHLVREQQPWPAPRDAAGRELPRRAGVSSFGFGGVNAHVVIEEYVPRNATRPDRAPGERIPVVLSATHPDVLRELATRWADALRRGTYGDADLMSIAYTSQTGRTGMRERLACLARTVDELREGLESWLRGEPADNVFSGRVPRGVDLPDVPTGLENQANLADADEQDRARLLDAWVQGAAIEWDRLYAGHRPRRIPLPTYPFRLRRYWVDTTRPANGSQTALDPEPRDDDGDIRMSLRGVSAPTLGGSTPAETASVVPAEPDDAYLLHLIEAIGQRELSADDFKRSLT